MSRRVKHLAKNECELCKCAGEERNPLQAHHSDGNPRNNARGNFLVVHMKVCHPFSDFITQFRLQHGQTTTPAYIKQAWTTFNWKD